MSISASGSNYISNASFDAWMEMKTSDAYTEMRRGMDFSGRRNDAEKALNGVKNQLLQLKTNGKDASEVTAAMHEAIDEFGDEFPDVKKALGEFVEVLDARAEAAKQAAESPTYGTTTDNFGTQFQYEIPPTHRPEPVHVEEKEIETWTSGISDTVDAMGQQDQLGLLNLQQLNSQINQAQGIRSAIADSRSEALDAIINRIG